MFSDFQQNQQKNPSTKKESIQPIELTDNIVRAKNYLKRKQNKSLQKKSIKNFENERKKFKEFIQQQKKIVHETSHVE